MQKSEFTDIEELESHFPAQGFGIIAYGELASKFIRDDSKPLSERARAIRAYMPEFGGLSDQATLLAWQEHRANELQWLRDNVGREGVEL
ncbi:hypothetical protein [Ewingella americana]|uniref:Uncharacterized protein n=1 Tax=Ewingella americana TaxID=41202 RepID=A0A502GEF9_9GAMM|nr:hypothetical protein [Ewingella americana]TPG60121.1 hypothetical protein EAH77_16260 [Ewingella americana]